jgi:photosystem II stability/assembly factor-like uncharacterized protein
MRTTIWWFLLCLSPLALSQGFNPWVKQGIGVPNRHAGCMMQAVDSSTFWSVFEAWDASSQEYVRTTNGGTTWLSDTVHVASSTYKSVSIYAFDENRAWVLMWDRVTQSGGGLFGTTNGGVTWKENATVFKKAANGVYGPDFIHFFDADNGVCVGDSSGLFEIYTTSDGGGSWSQVLRQKIPAKIDNEWGKTHVFTAAGNSLWFPTIGGKGRFYKTSDRGLTWSVLVYPKTPLWYYSMIAFQDENVGLCNSGWGDVEKTTDGGVTWTAIPTSVKLAFQDLKYVPHTSGMYVASAVWLCSALMRQYQCGTMYTVDAGAHWTVASASTLASSPSVFDLPLLSFSAPTSGWQGDMSENIFKWTVPSGRFIGVHPDSLIFRMIEVGHKSDTVWVDFVNHGSDPVTLSSIALQGTEFTMTKQPTLPVTLSSLGSARVELCFTPRADGTHHDSLVFLSNASNAPRANVVLGVIDKPYITLAPTLVDFGPVDVNTAFCDTAFIVNNIGGANDSILVSLDPINIVPDTAISVSPTAFILPPGGSQVVALRIRPRLLASSVYYNALVQINSRLSTVTPMVEANVKFNLVGTLGVFLVDGPPAQLALEQNYPNPFNPLTVIKYALPQKSHITLTVYNTLGQIVCELVNGDVDAGYHEVQFEATGLSSGVYFYRMRARDFIETKRLLLLR